MEGLLDLAEALLDEYGEEPPRPNFPLPASYNEQTPHHLMELKDGLKGKGWYAKEYLPAGTVLMVAKPIAMVMDWKDPTIIDDDEMDDNDEDDDEDDDDNDDPVLSKLSELLLVEILQEMQHKPRLWTDVLSKLFPRDEEIVSTLPRWVCRDDALFMRVEELLSRLTFSADTVKEITTRLPLIVRYNVLSVETSPELLVHPSPQRGYAALSGTALYHLPSFFNHDHCPNVSRYAVGDVMWFVANQNIPFGQEACLSYLEHDVLCEPSHRRTLMLAMDFAEPSETIQEHDNDDDGPDFPVVDADVQTELMGMEPTERLQAIQELTEQATGERLPQEQFAAIQEDEEMIEMQNNAGAAWFRCDVQNLRILHALTLDALGHSEQALALWQQCCSFADQCLPPHDEIVSVVCVQAALCAQKAGQLELAQKYADKALHNHNVLFGGGLSRFRRRYEREWQLDLRPNNDNPNKLWPTNNI